MTLPVWNGVHNFGVDQDTYLMTGHPAQLAARSQIELPVFTEVDAGPPIEARVDANRWIVECPDCHDAYYIWPDEPRPLFMCGMCLNAMVGHRWRPITAPADWKEIEAVLRARPLPQQRFWFPGETVEKLRDENRERDLPDEVR